jgi:hypothetical protein
MVLVLWIESGMQAEAEERLEEEAAGGGRRRWCT